MISLAVFLYVHTEMTKYTFFLQIRKKKNLVRSLEVISVGPYFRRKYGNCCYEFFHMPTLSASSLPLIYFYILEYIFSTVTLSNNQNFVNSRPRPFEQSLFMFCVNCRQFQFFTPVKRYKNDVLYFFIQSELISAMTGGDAVIQVQNNLF